MKIPDGWFVNNMIIFNEPDERGWAAKGFIVEVPDLRNASNDLKNEWHTKILLYLGTLRPPLKIQFQWSVDSDYRHELLKYDLATERLARNKWTYSVRKERFSRYMDRMLNRKLRREKLKIYLSVPIHATPKSRIPDNGEDEYYKSLLESLSSLFDRQGELLNCFLGGSGARLTPMTDQMHYLHYAEFLNPDYRIRSDYDPMKTFNPELSIQENCWHSGIHGNHKKASGGGNDYGFFMDGFYHSMIVMDRWPQTTYPGIIGHLTGLPILDYSITVNVHPLKIEDEIGREEKAIERIAGDYQSEKKHSLLTALDKKRRKVDALAGGFTCPFKAEFIIRISAQTKEELSGRCSAIKSAVNMMNGAGYWESSLPTTAMNLFFQTWPGWVFGKYSGHAIYAENQYLSDMLPISATFTGNLDDAESIYEGSCFNLVGIKNFTDGVPQHAAVFGMSGTGKSAFMTDLLSQTECFYDFTCIMEEGLSYGIYTQTQDSAPIIIHPDSEYTINYLDTHGLPLSPLHLATATALAAKMAGTAGDEDRQNLRTSQIMQYIDQLYTDVYEDWTRANAGLHQEIVRKAICVKIYKETVLPPGSTVIDAFSEVRNLLLKGDGQILEELHNISEKEITEFLSEPSSAKLVRDMAFSYFKPEQYPTHSVLVELMLTSPFRQHGRDEIKNLATLLSSWSFYGTHGKIFDGTTNIRLDGKIVHFELGGIPDAAEDLKRMTGFLIHNFTRNHIMTLPRSSRKRYVFEEAGRILDIEGGEKIISEGYAQMRKYGTWIVSIVQQYSRFKDTGIRPVVMGNSKQFFLMKQNDRGDLEDISEDIGLPEITREQIMNYPNPENLSRENRFSSLTYYHLDSGRPVCGTVRNFCSPEMLYCSSTDGAHFEKRAKELKCFGNGDITEAIRHFSNDKKEDIP
ncbi:MAG: hypothetical protein WAX69_06390 [Victivallales bacterium]